MRRLAFRQVYDPLLEPDPRDSQTAIHRAIALMLDIYAAGKPVFYLNETKPPQYMVFTLPAALFLHPTAFDRPRGWKTAAKFIVGVPPVLAVIVACFDCLLVV